MNWLLVIDVSVQEKQSRKPQAVQEWLYNQRHMWGWWSSGNTQIFFCLYFIFLSALKDLESSRWSGPHLWRFAWLGELQSWIPRLASTWAAGWPTCRTGRWPSHLSQDATVEEKRIIKKTNKLDVLGLQGRTVLPQFTRAAPFHLACSTLTTARKCNKANWHPVSLGVDVDRLLSSGQDVLEILMICLDVEQEGGCKNRCGDTDAL